MPNAQRIHEENQHLALRQLTRDYGQQPKTGQTRPGKSGRSRAEWIG